MNCNVFSVKLSVVFIGLALLAGCQGPQPKNGFAGNFKIGERAQVGPLIYNVYETQYMVSIGEGAEARIPNERFMIVHLTVVNGGGAASDQSIPTFTLVDDAGQTFTELDNGSGVPQWLGFARKVRPAESLSGNIVFDVSPKHYTLRIADETDEHFALVDLPLSYGTPATPPEAAPKAR